MKNFRTQFEIRYFPIIAFREHYKELIAPFITKTIFTINNNGNPDEYITFTRKDQSTLIDVRWDRIVILIEGENSLLLDNQGPLFTMHQILEKIKKMPTFVTINASLYDRAVLIQKDGLSLPQVKREFAEKYLRNFEDYNVGGEDTEIAIVENVAVDGSKDIAFARTFGPFNFNNDVTNYRLSPIHNNPGIKFKDFTGLLVTATYTRKLNTVEVLSGFKQSNDYFEENVRKILR